MTQNIAILGDYGKDLDDEHSLAVAAGLHHAGHIHIACVVATLSPAEWRAQIAKGTLKAFHLPGVPVGWGRSTRFPTLVHDHERMVPHAADAHELHPDGQELLRDTLRQSKQPVTLFLQAALTDAAMLLRQEPELARTRLERVVIMGGVAQRGEAPVLDARGYWTPNNASNNSFDPVGAEYVYRRLMELDIPTTVLTREAAGAARIPLSYFEQLAATGHPVGVNLWQRQARALHTLWKAANASEASMLRGTLPADRDRWWFLRTFCDGAPLEPDSDILKHVTGFLPYDGLTLLAGLHAFEDLFEPLPVSGVPDRFNLIGLSSRKHGIRSVDAVRKLLCHYPLYAAHRSLQPSHSVPARLSARPSMQHG